ncbi:MAG: serine/threonine protein kinase [Deltaproteobacteria bacterium]|nr:serine/threonine protein kinase [Deltaproteobacteria bacterium]
MLAAGQKLADRYFLEKLAGEGATAKVFRATDERTGKHVAIKVFQQPPSTADEATWLNRELKALSVLDHPNVVRMLDASPVNAEEPWICTEWLEGSDLLTLVNELGPLSEAAVVGIALGALAGLDAAHALTIVHRDIKPANIFLCRNGRVVLLDFGLARAVSDKAGKTLAGSAHTTVVGTPTYLSPEQLGEQAPNAASDIYSLGMTLRHLVLGKAPFSAVQILDLLKQIMKGETAPLPGTLTPALTQALDGMIALDINARLVPAKRARQAFFEISADLQGFARDFERFCQRADETTSVRIAALKEAKSDKTEVTQTAAETQRDTDVTRVPMTVAGEGTQIATITVKTDLPGGTQIATTTGQAVVRGPSRAPIFVTAGALAIVVGVAVAIVMPSRARQRPPVAVPTTVAPATAVPDALPAPVAIEPTKPPPEIPEVPPPPKAPVEAPRPGTLQITFKQWANVKIDGKDLGRRQLSARFELPAGKHKIFVQNPQYGERTLDVVVRAGQTAALDVDFKQ